MQVPEEMSATDVAAKYKKMTQREHIYTLTDTYVGGAEEIATQMFVYNTNLKFGCKQISNMDSKS